MATYTGSTPYAAVTLCERALRMIGAFSINDTAADEESLREALYWLDMQVAHQAGKTRCYWLVKQEIAIALAEDDSDYDLQTLVLDEAANGMQFPILAMLDDGEGNRTPIEIVRQREFLERSEPAESGRPEILYIDRLYGPTMHVFPVPDENYEDYSIVLTIQTFAPSFKPQGVTGEHGLGNTGSGFRPAWQMWAVTQLAANIGNGPVRALPPQRIKTYQDQADRLESDLLAYENREHETTPPIQEPSGY